MNNRPTSISKQISEDNLFSDRDDTEDNYNNFNYINKKQLMQLENDDSLTSVSDLCENYDYAMQTERTNENNNTNLNHYLQTDKKFTETPKLKKNSNNRNVSNKQKNNQKNNNPMNDELLKFISDTSDIFGDNFNLQNNLNMMNSFKGKTQNNNLQKKFEIFSTCQFDLYIAGNPILNNYNSEKFFTLQSQQSMASVTSREKNVYKEKFENLETRHSELNVNYNTLLEITRDLKEFYIKIFQNFLKM